MGINIAFALSQDGSFEKKHFGDADKYQIYQLSNKVFKLLNEEKNPYRSMDKTYGHGTKKKANSIIKYLHQKNVSVLVSRRFGTNINHIVNHFIPVEVNEESPEKVQSVLLKHMKWLQEELDKEPDRYKLFVINKGILKMAVDGSKNENEI